MPCGRTHCSMARMTQPTFGMIGLGTMGENLALNLNDHGTPVAVWNLETEWTDKFVAAHPDVTGTHTLQELVKALPRPRRMLMMIKAGHSGRSRRSTSSKPLLEPGDIVIDGGNSWFKDTQRREAAVAAGDLHFVGMGVSGGEEGARHGPSIMPGGLARRGSALKPILEAIAAQSEHGRVRHLRRSRRRRPLREDGAQRHRVRRHAAHRRELRRPAAARWATTPAAIADIFDKWNRGDARVVPRRAHRRRAAASSDPQTRQAARRSRPRRRRAEGHRQVDGAGRRSISASPIPTIAAAIDARVALGA